MKVIQAYHQGGKHKANNQPCEDRTYSLSKNGVSVIALADGAGSSKYTHSADGAECVTKTVSEFFCNNFDKFYEKESEEELSAVIMTVCQRFLHKKADTLGLDGISRLSSTLLCVAIKDNKVISCHIGDGVIGKLTLEGTEVVSAPENGEFASTTFFITNPNANQYIRIIKEELNDTISYFLMSDGTSDYIYNKFDNSFYDAAKKMALMTLEKNGQINLENTIKDYMVNKDPKSDDCSFICLTIDTTEEIDFKTFNDAIEKEDTTYEYVDTDISKIDDSNLSLIIDNFDHEKTAYKTYNDDSKKINKKTKSIILVISILVIVVALLSSMISKHIKRNEEISTESTISSITKIPASESTTSTTKMVSEQETDSFSLKDTTVSGSFEEYGLSEKTQIDKTRPTYKKQYESQRRFTEKEAMR